MKFYYFLIICFFISSCSGNKKNIPAKIEVNKTKHVVSFRSIIDTAKINGSVLIYDLKKDIYYSNNFKWANNGRLPASTFKIPNSIIALEIGIVKNDSTIFKWDGIKRFFKTWEQDLTFKEAFHFSCVPCYQEIARKIGEKRMNEYLNKLKYKNMYVDSTNIASFWLQGNSSINQFQQIDFLKRFHESKLPISKRTKKIMKQMMVMERNTYYTLRGKTGWSIANKKNNAWFVGYVQKKHEVYFFATNISPKEEFNKKWFLRIRKEVTYKALKQLEIIK